jgi:recombinational DNA repair ATPase RecF
VVADGAGSAIAGPKKASARATATSSEPVGFRERVIERLNAFEEPASAKKAKTKDEQWKYLVLGALDSEQDLQAALTGSAPEVQLKAQAKPHTAPRVAYLKSVTVEGFRGIGKPATLDLPPGPGLTLVIGRNGSGKSSFAEALELLLTGDTFRWKDKRSKVWKEGWRNLHHPKAVIEADFVLEGEKAPAAVKREWADGATLEGVASSVQIQGKAKTDFAALGWTAPLVSFRPFLSYSELGSMLEEGPSHLYDALASILGLDELVAAQSRLADARKTREKAHKDAADMRANILRHLPAIDDNRARVLGDALVREDWGLDDAEAVVSQVDDSRAADRALVVLRQIAQLSFADGAAVDSVIRALRDASQALKATAGTLAARSRDLAEVLDQVLRFHDKHGDGPCPVCGKKAALDAQWHEHRAQEVKDLRNAARDATHAHHAADVARKRALELPVPRADSIRQAAEVGLDGGEVLRQLEAWQKALSLGALDDVANAIAAVDEPLRKSVGDLKSRAAAEVQRREDAWRPLASQIHAWLPIARTARDGALAVKPLKAAEAWLKDTVALLRTEQFEPIKQKCQAIWSQLRQQSNVALEDIRLAGSATQRKVELDVTVDGVDGVALGVMSQGELHALALSLFIPRATLAESPFRFIVIDDPVQSMDPSRVDGLARVLETAASDRQVVVFTHDDRLPEAVRRLGIDATVLEVTRRESSAVEVRRGRDPVARHIEDAMAVAYTENLPAPAAKRVIPGLCRLAIEAACVETVRRRRLARGERHADVEDLLAGLSGTKSYAALALFDDAGRAGDVLPRLNKESKESADLFRVLNEGAHGAMETGYRVEIVRRSEKLAQWIQGLD